MGRVAASAQPAARLRGTIVSLDGNTLTLETRDGDKRPVVLAANYDVAAIVPAGNVRGRRAADGTLSASRVNVGKDGFTPANRA